MTAPKYTPHPARLHRVAGTLSLMDSEKRELIPVSGELIDEMCRRYDAAPELLEALQRLYDCPDLNLGNLEQESIDALEHARAAIAKATEGRT